MNNLSNHLARYNKQCKTPHLMQWISFATIFMYSNVRQRIHPNPWQDLEPVCWNWWFLFVVIEIQYYLNGIAWCNRFIPLHFNWREQQIAQAHIHSSIAAAVAGVTILMIRSLSSVSVREQQKVKCIIYIILAKEKKSDNFPTFCLSWKCRHFRTPSDGKLGRAWEWG